MVAIKPLKNYVSLVRPNLGFFDLGAHFDLGHLVVNLLIRYQTSKFIKSDH